MGTCSDCGGSGRTDCRYCNGTGEVGPGVQCNACAGSGEMDCETCGGYGTDGNDDDD